MPFVGIGVGIGRQRFASGIFAAYAARVAADGGTTEAGACVDAVSALMQTASLLLVPSGYKSGVVYSEKPTDGDGDLTFTRASTATRVNSDGEIESVATGVPRLDYSQGSCPALLLEPQRTNLLLRSEEFDNASWTKINTTVTANAEISPDGTQNAETMTISDSASRVQQSVILGPGTYTFSVYVKIISQTTAGAVRLVGLIDGSNVSAPFTPTTEWQRVTATYTAPVSLGNIQIRGYGGSEFAGTLAIWGAQLEVGAYPTSYIKTTTATVTRIADSFTRNNIYTNGLITASGGTWFVELRENVAYIRDAFSVGISIRSISDEISGDNLEIRNATGISQRLRIGKRIAGVYSSLFYTTTDTVKIAFKWNGTTADVFVNGVKVVSESAYTATNMEFLGANGNDVPYFIQQMALYPTPLSDTDCQLLTT